MKLFVPDHGNYEITYKAQNTPFINREKAELKSMVIEADDLWNARRKAEKQLKSYGYKFIIIEHVKPIKRTSSKHSISTPKTTNIHSSTNSTYSPINRNNHSTYSHTDCATPQTSASQGKSLNLWTILFAIAIVIIFIAILVSSYIKDAQVEGTYYLKSISGNVECSANNDENYCVLEDGECTLYFTLTKPAGSSIHTFTYHGKTINNIEFDKEFIKMNWDDCIEIKFDYGNGQYNIFTYEKK